MVSLRQPCKIVGTKLSRCVGTHTTLLLHAGRPGARPPGPTESEHTLFEIRWGDGTAADRSRAVIDAVIIRIVIHSYFCIHVTDEVGNTFQY